MLVSKSNSHFTFKCNRKWNKSEILLYRVREEETSTFSERLTLSLFVLSLLLIKKNVDDLSAILKEICVMILHDIVLKIMTDVFSWFKKYN